MSNLLRSQKMNSLLPHLILFLSFSSLPLTSLSTIDTLIFVGCTLLRYTPNSTYESNLNSLLTSLVNSATHKSYNNYTIQGSSSQQDALYGLYQCRADLSMPDCATCIALAVSQLGSLCPSTCGGALQLEGCYVKYGNSTFLGVEDKTVVLKKCGPSVGYEVEVMAERDAVLAAVVGSGGAYRVEGAGKVQGVAQCVGDLSASECQDCVGEAIGRLKSDCGMADYGDMFLGKCYARYSTQGPPEFSNEADHDRIRTDKCSGDVEKKIGIVIGLLAGVGVVVTFLVVIQAKVFQRTDTSTNEISPSRTFETEIYIPVKIAPIGLQVEQPIPQSELLR